MTRVILSDSSREIRRQLSPTVWTVLEEVALDAADEDGVLVAATSSRRIADQLGVAPSTAASALLQLRRRRLLRLEQRGGPAGRFGLAVYTIAAIPGLSVELPCVGPPHAVTPCAADDDVAGSVDEPGCPVPPTRHGGGVKPDQALLDLRWSGPS